MGTETHILSNCVCVCANSDSDSRLFNVSVDRGLGILYLRSTLLTIEYEASKVHLTISQNNYQQLSSVKTQSDAKSLFNLLMRIVYLWDSGLETVVQWQRHDVQVLLRIRSDSLCV